MNAEAVHGLGRRRDDARMGRQRQIFLRRKVETGARAAAEIAQRGGGFGRFHQRFSERKNVVFDARLVPQPERVGALGGFSRDGG